MAAAYALMIRCGIDTAPMPTKINMPSAAFLADQAALVHNYALFSASYAPVISSNLLPDTSRGSTILPVPLHNAAERPATLSRYDPSFCRTPPL